MPDTEMKRDDLITIYKAARSLGIKVEVILYQIDTGNIEASDGMIYESICKKISQQQATYIGVKTFLKKHDSDKF